MMTFFFSLQIRWTPTQPYTGSFELAELYLEAKAEGWRRMTLDGLSVAKRQAWGMLGLRTVLPSPVFPGARKGDKWPEVLIIGSIDGAGDSWMFKLSWLMEPVRGAVGVWAMMTGLSGGRCWSANAWMRRQSGLETEQKECWCRYAGREASWKSQGRGHELLWEDGPEGVGRL